MKHNLTTKNLSVAAVDAKAVKGKDNNVDTKAEKTKDMPQPEKQQLTTKNLSMEAKDTKVEKTKNGTVNAKA